MRQIGREGHKGRFGFVIAKEVLLPNLTTFHSNNTTFHQLFHAKLHFSTLNYTLTTPFSDTLIRC